MAAATDTNTDTPSGGEEDPHSPKMAADDPRLRVHRPPSRVLKMGPVFGAIAAIFALGGYAVLASVRKSDDARVTREPTKAPVTLPAVPALIQEAPSTPEVLPPPAQDLPAAAPAPLRATFDAPPRSDPREQQALQQELARRAELVHAEAEARTSGLFFASSAPAGSGAAPPPAALLPVLPGAGLPGGALAQNTDVSDPNLQLRKNAFLDSPRAQPDYLPTTLQHAFSPYEVKATTIIPATLITGINSDLPGPIIAQVREQVYDTVTGQHLLIPQGARLLASYDSMVAWGQERVLMCWNRIVFPNGSSINLQCMAAADLKGQAGLTDEVDNHWSRLLAAVGLSTVLSLGAQAVAGDPSGYQPNLAQSAARNAAGQINAAGQGIVQRQINIQPTITVRPGFGVNVLVTKDMVLEPYTETGEQ
jgi:type IV secretory pathway VirB10-like protein